VTSARARVPQSAVVASRSLRPVRPVRVMISSRCGDTFDGQTLSTHRRVLQKDLESEKLFGEQVFEVWINETAGPAPGLATWWEWCIAQARDADLVIVLYDGHSGGTLMQQGGVGICDAEFVAAMAAAPHKVRVIYLDPLQSPTTAADVRFKADLEVAKPFRMSAATGAELRGAVRQSVLDGLRGLALLGSREAKRGRAWTGSALVWTRLDFANRRAAMREVLLDALGAGAAPLAGNAVTTLIDGHEVLAVCDAIPAALTVAAARELAGQPFLRDHQFAPLLTSGIGGPVHFIACHRGVTEAQGLRQLGFSDAIVVHPPFGVYVADEVQKIQMLFLADCRDPTTTRSRVDEAREWLDRAQEAPELRRRADERAQVVRLIASVQRAPLTATGPPPSGPTASSSAASRTRRPRGRRKP
jgi:hypothetical protein